MKGSHILFILSFLMMVSVFMTEGLESQINVGIQTVLICAGFICAELEKLNTRSN